MVLLDLNLPKVTGYEVLEEVKTDVGLRHIPVIILSGSTFPEDVDQCYRVGANLYLVKPGSPETLQRTVNAIYRLWFDLGRVARRHT